MQNSTQKTENGAERLKKAGAWFASVAAQRAGGRVQLDEAAGLPLQALCDADFAPLGRVSSAVCAAVTQAEPALRRAELAEVPPLVCELYFRLAGIVESVAELKDADWATESIFMGLCSAELNRWAAGFVHGRQIVLSAEELSAALTRILRYFFSPAAAFAAEELARVFRTADAGDCAAAQALLGQLAAAGETAVLRRRKDAAAILQAVFDGAYRWPVFRGKVNGLRFLQYLTDGTIFWQPEETRFEDGTHTFGCFALDERRSWKDPDLFLGLAPFLADLDSFLQTVEADEKLRMPLTNVSSEMLRGHFRGEDITGLSWLNLFSTPSLTVTDIGERRFLLTIAQEMQQLVPGGEECIFELLRTVLGYNGRTPDEGELAFSTTDAADVFRGNGLNVGNSHLWVRTMLLHIPE